MAEAVIKLNLEWRLVPTTCEPCTACKEIIYGQQYRLFIDPGGFAEIKLCESCYTEVIKED